MEGGREGWSETGGDRKEGGKVGGFREDDIGWKVVKRKRGKGGSLMASSQLFSVT